MHYITTTTFFKCLFVSVDNTSRIRPSGSNSITLSCFHPYERIYKEFIVNIISHQMKNILQLVKHKLISVMGIFSIQTDDQQ